MSAATRGKQSTLPSNADLADEIRDGRTCDDLADDYDVSPTSIRVRVRDAGWDPDTGYPFVDDGDQPPTIGRLPDLPGALCAQTDPDAFYPEKGGSVRDAKATCLRCEVRDACLEYAMDNGERYGIWGGLSERDRRKLRAQRAATAAEQDDEQLEAAS